MGLIEAGKKKIKEMQNTYNQYTGYKYKAGTLPTLGNLDTTLSIALFSQETLDKISEICLPKAGAAEFQVHYRGLQLLVNHPENGTRLVFTIPTVFFNMPQTVTSGSVSFNLDEVTENSEMVKPISEGMSSAILKSFPLAYFKDQGFEVTARELEMGSIHRHPGDFGFSIIDMDNSVETPGIIFRRNEATDLVQVDSVIYIPNKKAKLVVTESRVINVKPVEDGREGTYLDSPTISVMLNNSKSFSFNNFFGRGDSVNNLTIEGTSDNDLKLDIEKVFNDFLKNLPDYQPQIIVNPEFIQQQVYTTRHYGGYNVGHNGKKKGKTKTYETYGFDDYYSDDGYDDYDIYHMNQQQKQVTFKTEEEKRMEARQTWRKSHTTRMLSHTHGIDLNTYPDIDGSASNNDIISIVESLYTIGKTHKDITKILISLGYPATASFALYENYIQQLKTAVTEETDAELPEDITSELITSMKEAYDEGRITAATNVLQDAGFTNEELKELFIKAGIPPVLIP